MTGVTYPEETETEELTPEEMLVNEEEKAATEEQERIRQEVERILRDKDRGARAYENLYGALRSVAMDSLYYLVDVSEISSDTDWFNDPYETRGTVSGIIIAKTDSEAQLLVYSPGINAAQTIQVTFYDSSSVEGAIRSYDRVSGFAVLSVSLEGMSPESKEKLRTANLGSSSPSVVLGRPVIAVRSKRCETVTTTWPRCANPTIRGAVSSCTSSREWDFRALSPRELSMFSPASRNSA